MLKKEHNKTKAKQNTEKEHTQKTPTTEKKQQREHNRNQTIKTNKN